MHVLRIQVFTVSVSYTHLDVYKRQPYTVYMQGGLNFAAARAGVLLGADRMLRLRRSE